MAGGLPGIGWVARGVMHRRLGSVPSGYGSQTTPPTKAVIVLTILLIIIVLLLLFGGGWGYSRRGRRI
jgi:hypothetical protein